VSKNSAPPKSNGKAGLINHRPNETTEDSIESAQSYSSSSSQGMKPMKSTHSSFVERSAKWKQEREARLQAELEKKLKEKFIEEMRLPFRPQLNPKSKEILQNPKYQRTSAKEDIPRAVQQMKQSIRPRVFFFLAHSCCFSFFSGEGNYLGKLEKKERRVRSEIYLHFQTSSEDYLCLSFSFSFSVLVEGINVQFGFFFF
jgi:hypothetical protein